MAQCGRCGAERSEVYTLKPRGNELRRRETVCAECRTEAHENRGLTAAEIVKENARWERIFRRSVDPDYYLRTPARIGSSFGAFATLMEFLCR